MRKRMGTPARADQELGQRLRVRREQAGLSLSQVAARADVTKGFLSQLERGLSRASVASLRRIADAVGIGLAELLDAGSPTRDVTNAPKLHGGRGATDALLTPVGHPAFQVLHATVEPGGQSDFGPVGEPEAHFVHVLRGRFELRVDDDTHVLRTGQSLTFTTPCAYGWRNPSQETVAVLWVFSPPAF
jgi:transcriptional regulator with XRE-family HTH domain